MLPFAAGGYNTRAKGARMSHTELMDRIYRRQRHFYDLTRRLFLPGRDRLLDGMEIRKGDRILEVGCGTARNLIRLAKRHPEARFYGLDASEEMLKTAKRKVAKAGLAERIRLAKCLASELDPAHHFGEDEPFDVVFFSYSLSMMPTCVEALEAALRTLRPGGCLHIVDFWDQKGWFRPLRWALGKWLSLFHVKHRPEIISHLEEVCGRTGGRLAVEPVFGRYAFVARYRRPGAAPR